MTGLWAVSVHTFRQCLRMKVAGLFILLLAAALLVMPFGMRGDGTLAGQVRTFLSYSTSITALLLSLVTVFLVVGVVTSDVRTKLIFSVATKPIARWQYLLGRWLGVVMLDAVLLALAGGLIFALAQYLRTGQALNPTDRRAVETEVFTARAAVAPAPLQIDQKVQKKIADLRESGQIDYVLESYLYYASGDPNLAVSRLQDDLRTQEAQTLQSIAPGKSTEWQFSGIHVAGKETTDRGRVVRVEPEQGVVVVQASSERVSRLMFSTPIRIQEADGRIVDLSTDAFAVQFAQEQMASGQVGRLAAGQEVEFVIDPTVQIRFKASSSATPAGGVLASGWEVVNQTTGFRHIEQRSDPPDQEATVVVSARAVDEQGRMTVRYYNLNMGSRPLSVTVLHDDVGVLYPVSSFEWNFVRSLALVLIQLVFLAALGVLAGSFLSFPVACLFTLFLLVTQWGMGFLIEASNPKPGPSSTPGALDYVPYYIIKGLHFLLPGRGDVSPSDYLVDGMRISLATLGYSALQTVVVVSGLLLVVACVIFSKRELARVQV